MFYVQYIDTFLIKMNPLLILQLVGSKNSSANLIVWFI